MVDDLDDHVDGSAMLSVSAWKPVPTPIAPFLLLGMARPRVVVGFCAGVRDDVEDFLG